MVLIQTVRSDMEDAPHFSETEESKSLPLNKPSR